MPNFLASLPLAGVDGTMSDRRSAVRAAYVKTGYLAEVRALAGYVFAASGHRYVVVALHQRSARRCGAGRARRVPAVGLAARLEGACYQD